MRFRILALMMLLFGHCPGQTIAEAEALFLKHKIPDALEICEQLAKVDSTSGAANYVMGKIYISVKNYNAALPVLQKAIDIDNDRTYVSAWAHAYLGEYYYHSGDFKKQEAELRQAIELNKTENSVEFAQSQLMGLYTEQRRFTLALPLARHLQQKDIANPEPYLALGEIHKSMGKPDSAVFYLHEAIKLNDDKTWVSGMAHLHLGETYITVGDYEDAAYELNNAIRLNKTSNSVKLARQILDSMNYLSPVESPLLKKLSAPTWVVIEGGNITYNFQDTTGLGPKVQLYIAEHELAYLKINEVFHATLPKKLTLYVWNDPVLAKVVTHRVLGFTIAKVCVSNVAFTETVGHEMAHILCFWGFAPEANISRLVNEGVAVAFDQSAGNRIDAAKKALAGKKYKSILDLWNNDDLDEGVFNQVAGAFMEYLYQQSTPEQFKSLVKDQGIAHAETIYGATEFKKLVNGFNKQVGLNGSDKK